MNINLANIRSITELHQIFKDKLDFPNHYGCNWDAFWDCITSIANMPDTLILSGWEQFSFRFPNEQKTLRVIINDYNKATGKKIKTS